MADQSSTPRDEELEREDSEIEPENVEELSPLTGQEAALAEAQAGPAQPGGAAPVSPAWLRVKLARHPKRPHALDYFQRLAPDFTELHGDRCFGDDAAIVCGYGHLSGRAVMLV